MSDEAEQVTDVEKLVARGRETYGHAEFDAKAQRLQDKLGPAATGELGLIASQYDDGPAIVNYYDEHPGEVERLKSLPMHRRVVEIGRIQGKLSGGQQMPTTAQPVYQTPSGGGNKMSVAEFNRTGGANIRDTGEWMRMWEKSNEEKNKRGRPPPRMSVANTPSASMQRLCAFNCISEASSACALVRPSGFPD
jgi:hypothetical protein